MKTIQTTKRLYSIASSPPLKQAQKSSSGRPIPSSPRPRRGSFSLSSSASASSSSSNNVPPSVAGAGVGGPNSRSLYTNASGPLHYFDSGPLPPPAPPPTSRPGNQHAVSTSRLSAGEAQTSHGNAPGNTAQNPQSPSHSQTHSQTQTQPTQQATQSQSHHGGQQAEGSSQPLLGSTSLTLSFNPLSSPPGSSPPDRGLLRNGSHGGLATSQTSRTRGAAADGMERQREGEQMGLRKQPMERMIYQLDVGAYGIPKRGRERARGRDRACMCASCVEESDILGLDSLDGAMQVGEDAYFVREDALGVADGVGGWGSRTSKPSSLSHSCSSCAAASTSTSRRGGHSHHQSSYYSHRPVHRTHPVQPSPSALFARRLMHFCAREVGEARASAAAVTEQNIRDEERKSDVIVDLATSSATRTTTTTPNLKHCGVAPRVTSMTTPGIAYPLQRKMITRERGVRGNARPFTWPWEAEEADNVFQHPEYVTGVDVFVEDAGEKKIRTALGDPTFAKCADVKLGGRVAVEATEQDSKADVDPLAGTIDPVDVLERAYTHALNAHRVRRRVRVVRTHAQKAAPRWWTYGIGLGSASPSTSLKSMSTLKNADVSLKIANDEDCCEWEWEERWEPLVAGSSTALLAVLSGDRLRIAHLGDCVGWLVRAGEVVWRSEEMWWGFNYPLQLGPASPTRPCDARRYELTVQADDILILASDGMSDNLWEEDVLDEVRRAVEVHAPLATEDATLVMSQDGKEVPPDAKVLGRRTLAGMLSEALCSRARRVSEQARGPRMRGVKDNQKRDAAPSSTSNPPLGSVANAREAGEREAKEAEEVPFARRAREEGRSFLGGKCDDISVLVAVISPAVPTPAPASPSTPSVVAASALPQSQPASPALAPVLTDDSTPQSITA